MSVYHILLSASLNKKWESYSDISNVLFDEGLIDESRKDLLISMAGFRNRLSNDYLGLDLDIIINIINHRLYVFNYYAKLISG